MRLKVGRCLLREILYRKRISPIELAEKVGMKKQQISKYINNETEMMVSTAMTLAYALNIRVEELFEWEFLDE